MCETRSTRCEAVVSWEETGECTRRTSRGMGPSTCTRNSETTSGRAISQQGLATTCKDPSARGTGVGGRVLVWRMSPYERRRRGNALRDGTRCRSPRGDASKGQRGSRHRAGSDEVAERSIDSEQSDDRFVVVELRSKPGERGVYVGQRLSFRPPGKASQGNARVANRIREIRPSGMKTGARGNVTYGEPRNPTRNRKSGAWSLLTYRCARLGSIQTISLYGSGEGPGWVTAPGYSTRPFAATGPGIGVGVIRRRCSHLEEVRLGCIGMGI